MVKLAVLFVVVAGTPARADTPDVRPGALIGIQQTDRTAWVFGPSLEVRVYDDFSIRGEAHLELGDIDDPFGPSNIRGGTGPHVNHVMFGPSWRPKRYARYGLAAGASAGVLVLHSTFADPQFTKKPAAGVFVQAGHMLGPVSLALQLRVDVSASVPMAGPEGERVPTSSARFNLAFEVPIDLW
jgi:hypothetical protein